MENTQTMKATAAPAPGVYRDTRFEDYLRWPLLSQSALKEGRKSMAHLRAYMEDGLRKEPTDDMRLGSALHCAFLEPELMLEKVALWQGAARRGKEWEAFKLASAGKTILTECQYEKLIGMTRSLRAACRERHDLRRWYAQIEAVELGIVGAVHGVPMKCRLDALTPDPIFDVKKVADGDQRLFQSRAYQLGYHIQAFIYTQLAERERFIILAVEDAPPYDVVSYPISDNLMRQGAAEACDLLERVTVCRQTGAWPGRSTQPVELDVPAWKQNEKDAASFLNL